MTRQTSTTKNRKLIALSDFYSNYPYKWWDVNSNTVPVFPYVPKSQISEHEWKLTKVEWMKVIKTYHRHVFEHMLDGSEFIMPQGLGVMRLRKKPIDDNYRFEYQKIKAQANPPGKTFGYSFFMQWYRTKARFKLKSLYQLRFTHERLRALYKHFHKNPLSIYNIPDV
jgi:hypothetical protein